MKLISFIAVLRLSQEIVIYKQGYLEHTDSILEVYSGRVGLIPESLLYSRVMLIDAGFDKWGRMVVLLD